jgi:DNA-binding PadR family transcriptional regulator
MRATRASLRVLAFLLKKDPAWTYGVEISSDGKVRTGTVFSILDRLRKDKLVEDRWEDYEKRDRTIARPPRRMHRLTVQGKAYAIEKLKELE